MKILHIPFTWFPSPCGGTEVYVQALVRELTDLGWENHIAVPAEEPIKEIATGSPTVHRLPMSESVTLDMMHGSGDPISAAAFADLLARESPDIVHFHAFSPAISLLWLAAARERKIACVYTYHTPTVSCARGTLMRWGTIPCDGEMTPLRCAACSLHGLGLPQPMAAAAACLSPLAQWLASIFPSGARWQLPLRARPLAAARAERVRRWFAGMDRIVVLCEWTRRVLEINQLPSSKITVARHGLPQRFSPPPRNIDSSNSDRASIRLAFFGRLDMTKGLHVILAALQRAPSLPVTLDIFALAATADNAFGTRMLKAAGADPRVRFVKPVPADEVPQVLACYDALLVPSLWLETGPLVVLEAFAAGVPVIGSDLGGIAEWVTDGVDGLLVPPGDPDAWCAALQRLADEPGLLPQLRSGIRPPRSMDAVAAEMAALYQQLLI